MPSRKSSLYSHWPLYTTYQQAMRHPKLYFDDPALKGGEAEIGMYGLPQTYSGNFGCVFKYRLANNEIRGLKCFSSFLRDREQRYAAITEFHDRVASSFLMDFEYKANQLFVEGQRYPLLMMEWIQGRAMDAYIEHLLEGDGDPGPDLTEVANEFAAVVGALDAARVSHGDLQHGNIMITPGGLRLVDLDGMFVPAIAQLGAVEMGLRDYQHPKRDVNVFGPELDRFSALVIYLSLKALKEDPSLWERYHIDLNLILKAEDFRNPESSDVFARLSAMKGEVARLTQVLIRACALPPLATPSLASLVGPTSRPLRTPAAPGISVTDASGREVDSLMCCLSRVGSGRCGGSLSFTIRNLGSAPTWVTVASTLPGLDVVGARAFLIEASARRQVTCRVSLARALGEGAAPTIKISSGRWHAPDTMSYRDIDLKILAVGLRRLDGDEFMEIHRRAEDMGARRGDLAVVLENLGNVGVRIAPSVKPSWLRLVGGEAIQLEPAERRQTPLATELVGPPPTGATTTIDFKVTPVTGEDVEFEEAIRLKILDPPSTLVDRFRSRFRSLRRLAG